MITYSKTTWGLHLLLRLYGSAFPRSLIFSVISTSITVALYVTKERQLYDDWRHPYPYHIFAFIVGFIVVFRSQLSYARYWEGRLQLQTMTARWADFCTEALMMDAGTLSAGIQSDPKAWNRAKWFTDTTVHLSSLLHGVALQHLRSDWDLSNLTTYHSIDPAPPLDGAGLRAASKGKYQYDLTDTFLLRGTTERMERYNRAMPLPVIGSISDPEAVGLGKLLEAHCQKQTGTLFNGIDIASDDHDTIAGYIKSMFVHRIGKVVPGASERVNIVYAWVQQLLQERFREKGLTLAAPVGSRMWQMLSEGYLQFEQCRAIADTPFPFPWAQMVLVMLIMYAISVPLVVVAFVDSTWMGIVVNFFCVQSYWCLNEVARDLEDPFIYDPNDLPLARYQYQFNNRILAAARTRRPVSAYEIMHAEECGSPDFPPCKPAGVITKVLHITFIGIFTHQPQAATYNITALRNKGRQARRTESLTPRGTEQTAASPPPGFRASHGQTNTPQLQRSVSQQAGLPVDSSQRDSITAKVNPDVTDQYETGWTPTPSPSPEKSSKHEEAAPDTRQMTPTAQSMAKLHLASAEESGSPELEPAANLNESQEALHFGNTETQRLQATLTDKESQLAAVKQHTEQLLVQLQEQLDASTLSAASAVSSLQGELAAKVTEAQAGAVTAAEAAAQLQEQRMHAQSLHSQFSQAQQALEDLKHHQAAAQRKAHANEASLKSALRAKDSELRDIQLAVASSQAMAAAGSLGMPEGSVNNPLADQPEQDDHQIAAGMLPLSSQLSSHTVNGDKEGNADGKSGVPASGGVVEGQASVKAALAASEASAIASSRATQIGTNTQVSSAANSQQAVEGSALPELSSVAATPVTAHEVHVIKAGRESVATLKRVLQEHPLAVSPLQADRGNLRGLMKAPLPAGSTSVAETRQLDLVVTPQESYTNGDLKKGAWSPLEHHAPGRLSAQESQMALSRTYDAGCSSTADGDERAEMDSEQAECPLPVHHQTEVQRAHGPPMQEQGYAADVLSRARFSLWLWGSHTRTKPTVAPHSSRGLDAKMNVATLPLTAAPPVASLPESADSFPPLDLSAPPESPLKHFLPRAVATQSAQKQSPQLRIDLSPVVAPSASPHDKKGETPAAASIGDKAIREDSAQILPASQAAKPRKFAAAAATAKLPYYVKRAANHGEVSPKPADPPSVSRAKTSHAVKIDAAAPATLHLSQPPAPGSELSRDEAEAHLQGMASFLGEQAALDRPAPDEFEKSPRKPALLYIKAHTEEAEGPATVVFRRAFSVDKSSSRDRPGAPYAFTGQHWLNQDFTVPSLEAWLWLFTKLGMVYPITVQELPAESRRSKDGNVEQIVSLEVGDEVIEVMLIPNKPAKEELVVLVTAAGFMTKQPIKRLLEQTWEADDIKPFKCMTVQAGDAVGWVCKADLESHILIATSAGYLLRFRITPILAGDFDDVDSNTTLGVSSTWNDSRVVGLAVVTKNTADSASARQHIAHVHGGVLLVTGRGFAKRVPLAEFPEQNEGQKGMKAISLDVGDLLVAMHAFTFQGAKHADPECIVALSSKGNATKRLVTTVPVFARAAAGHHLLKMQEGERIAQVLCWLSVLGTTRRGQLSL
ncbi:hypothetical protein WJX79_001551 [Trebouxia sp. C0005]